MKVEKEKARWLLLRLGHPGHPMLGLGAPPCGQVVLLLTQALCDSVMNLDDLTRRGLYLSDIPLHDATRDLVLLGEQFREEYKLTQELEILTDRLQLTLRALEDEKKKTDT